MRSMFMLAALVAVIGFTGCCGAGGNCKLGGCLAGGKSVISSAGAQASSASTNSCGCSSGGCSSGGCGASGGAVGACGPDSVVTASAPYACDGGCGGSAQVSAAPTCSCPTCAGSGSVEYAPAQYAPAPVQYAPIEYAPAAPVQSGGCSACGTASVDEPSGFQARRAARKEGLSNNCLLYTSPSPRDGLLSRMPSSA